MLIEQAMIFALGFLAALLTILLFLPAFWARAIRLSVRRVAEQLPLSMAEIAAERDGLRAEAAIVQRRLEQERDRAVAAQTRLRGENGRMAVEVANLQDAVEEQRLAAFDLQTALAETRRALSSSEAALVVMSKDHYDSSGLLERAKRSVEELRAEMQHVREISDQRRVTIASLETRIEGLQATIDDLDACLREAERHVAVSLDDLHAATRARDEARTEIVRLQGRKAELDARVASQSAYIGRLESAGEDRGGGKSASSEIARQWAIIARREETILADASRYAQLEAQMKRLSLEHAETEQQLTNRIEALRSEKFDIEGMLETARRERDNAQRELRHVRASSLPGGSGAESEDFGLLRRSIVEVAADVVRLLGDKDADAGTSANVLQLRRERVSGSREAGGKSGGTADASAAANHAVNVKLS